MEANIEKIIKAFEKRINKRLDKIENEIADLKSDIKIIMDVGKFHKPLSMPLSDLDKMFDFINKDEEEIKLRKKT